MVLKSLRSWALDKKTLMIKFKDAAGVFGKLDVAFRRILYFLPDEDKKTLRCVSSW